MLTVDIVLSVCIPRLASCDKLSELMPTKQGDLTMCTI